MNSPKPQETAQAWASGLPDCEVVAVPGPDGSFIVGYRVAERKGRWRGYISADGSIRLGCMRLRPDGSEPAPPMPIVQSPNACHICNAPFERKNSRQRYCRDCSPKSPAHVVQARKLKTAQP